jgi:Arc/MetJ-type ribon-helix-helix transcriptional regulator
MRLNVELTRDLYTEVAAHADRQGRSLSDVVRELLRDWCRRQRREELVMVREFAEGSGQEPAAAKVDLELVHRDRRGAKEG